MITQKMVYLNSDTLVNTGQTVQNKNPRSEYIKVVQRTISSRENLKENARRHITNIWNKLY